MVKKIAAIVAGLLVILIGGLAAVVATINPNQFKPMLVEQVKQQTGFDLVIDGDIDWQFWPSLGFSVADVAVKNRPGFDEPNLLALSRAQMSIDVLPLLSQQLHVGEILLQDPRIFVQTLANGETNLTPQQAESETTTESTPVTPSNSASPAETQAAGWDITLQGLRVSNASVLLKDDQASTQTRLDEVNVEIGNLAPAVWTPVSVSLVGSQNAETFSLQGQGDVKLMTDPMQSQLRQFAMTLSAQSGDVTLREANLTLESFALGEASALGFNAKLKTADMDVETSGKAQVTVASSLRQFAIQGLDMLTTVSGEAVPNQSITQQLAADIDYDMDANVVTVTDLVGRLNTDQVIVDGKVAVKLTDIPQVRFALNTNRIDVDALLPSTTETPQQDKGNAASASSSSAAPQGQTTLALSREEPDLSALQQLDVAGTLALQGLKVANVELGQTEAEVAINRGKVTLSRFVTEAYQGTVSASAVLDASVTPARYEVSKRARGIEVLPLLQGAAEVDLLAGKGNVDVNVQGKGLSPYALREAINGRVAIFFEDGAINGINLAQMLREAKATLKGEKSEYVDEVRKTDFSALTASFVLGNGMARTNDLLLEAPALRVRSEGQTDLLKETLDFAVYTSVVETSKGQGGKDIDELRDVTIPVDVAGTWQAPSYKLDIKKLLSSNKVLEEKARKEAQRGIKKLLGDKADDEKVKEAADKLLNLFQ